MTFKQGESCLDEVTIKILTERDEDDPSDYQIRLEISHDNSQDKEVLLFPEGIQLQDLDIQARLEIYFDNHWDSGISYNRLYGNK